MKKIILSTLIVTTLISTTVFAAGKGIQAKDGSGIRQGTGIGNGGESQLGGIGGLGLQDGSCFIGDDGNLYYLDSGELVLDKNSNSVNFSGKGLNGMQLQLRDGSCYIIE